MAGKQGYETINMMSKDTNKPSALAASADGTIRLGAQSAANDPFSTVSRRQCMKIRTSSKESTKRLNDGGKDELAGSVQADHEAAYRYIFEPLFDVEKMKKYHNAWGGMPIDFARSKHRTIC